MAFDPTRLYSALLNTGLQIKDNPLYQVIYQLINAVSKLTVAVFGSVSGSGSGGLATQSYITVNNDSATLPNSRQLLAGLNVTFDDTIINQRTINVDIDAGYWTPLTDGDEDETDLIFANGDAIMMFIPTP